MESEKFYVETVVFLSMYPVLCSRPVLGPRVGDMMTAPTVSTL